MSHIYTAQITCEAISFRAKDVDDAEAKYSAYFDDGICPEHWVAMAKCGCLVEEDDSYVVHIWDTDIVYDGPITIEERN